MAALFIGLGVAFFFLGSVAILAFGLSSGEQDRAKQAAVDESRIRTTRFFAILREDGKQIRVKTIEQSTLDRVEAHLRREREAASDFVNNPSFETLHGGSERRVSAG